MPFDYVAVSRSAVRTILPATVANAGVVFNMFVGMCVCVVLVVWLSGVCMLVWSA